MEPVAPEKFVEVEFTVEPNYAGWRLDLYLKEKLRRLSRTRIRGIIERSLVADRPLKPSSPVTPGLRFRLRKLALTEPETPREVREVHLDEGLLVLDKPAGLPVHPTARYHKGTLVGLLRERYGPGAAHPAHRLDRETSGLMVCGRTRLAAQRLMALFAGGQVHKEYLAVCEGHPASDRFSVDAPIAEGTAEVRIAVRIDREVGKPALTDFVVLERFEYDGAPLSLIRALPRTGRQHQIRVHLRQVSHPLVGDKIYGPDPGYFDRFSKGTLEPEAWARLRLPRHALHAARITFPHPFGQERCDFSSPLPDDLLALLPAASRAE